MRAISRILRMRAGVGRHYACYIRMTVRRGLCERQQPLRSQCEAGGDSSLLPAERFATAGLFNLTRCTL